MRPAAATQLDEALLQDLFLRGKTTVMLSVPVALMVAGLHYGNVPPGRLGGWFVAMAVIQAARTLLANAFLRATPERQRATGWMLRLHLSTLAAGVCWGSMLFVLDTGQQDFSLLFKFLALTAILGTVLNSMSARFLVYANFVIATTVPMFLFLLGPADFLDAAAKISLALGTAIYAAYLLLIGWRVHRLTRLYFTQQAEREDALARLNEAHAMEKELRRRLQEESKKLEETNQKLQNLAWQDSLTGVSNRRYLVEQLERCIHATQRHAFGFSLILLDIDHFKGINDTHGHLTGDQALIAVAGAFKRQLRDIDVFGRWGGEEFLAILPGTSFDEAMACAERLRKFLETSRLLDTAPGLTITSSFGVSTYMPGEDANRLVSRADAQLYAAKAAGRNRVMGQPGP